MVENTQFYAISHIGNSRNNQEDSFLLHQGGILPSDVREEMKYSRSPYIKACSHNTSNFIVAVSDGMGGHAAGEVASSIAIEYLSENYQRLIESAYLNEQFIASEICAINRMVVNSSRKDNRLKGMGATLCGVICSNDMYYGFNVGDSRLYRYHNNQLEQLSSDHTEGQRLRKLNLLTEEEYLRFPRRKHLYKYIGVNSELIPDVFKIGNCIPGNTLVLCSDGLTDALSDEEIATILSKDGSVEYKGHLLIDCALERNIGHGDNITLILIEF